MNAGRRILQWFAIGFTLTCLLGAAVLGVFAATSASRASCATADCAEIADRATSLSRLSAGIAVAAVLVSLTMWLTSAGGRIARRIAAAALLVAGAGLFAAYRWSGFIAVRNRLDELLPATQQMWVVSPTVVLAVGGVVAAALTLLTAPGGRARPGWIGTAGVAVGTAAAVALTVVLTVPALEKGDDSRYVTTTVAAATDIPPLPARLGTQRFEMPWPIPPYNDTSTRPQAAGAGFVAMRPGSNAHPIQTVIGYDTSGRERWQYSRNGPGTLDLSQIRVYDGGGVVLAFFSGTISFVTAVDALTGAELWTSDDPAVVSVFYASRYQSPSPFLVARRGADWTAYDARTGERKWRIPNPVRCPGPRKPMRSLYETIESYDVDSATRLTTIGDCSTADRINLREFSVDPATGGLIIERPVPGVPTATPADALRWYASPMGSNGYNASISWKDRRPSFDRFVDMATGRSVDLEDGAGWASNRADGGFLMRYSTTMRQYTGSGDLRCEFELPTKYYVSVAMLGDQILVFDDTDEQRPVIRLLDRADCRETGTVPAPGTGDVPRDVYTVRGVTMIIERHHTGTMTKAFGYS